LGSGMRTRMLDGEQVLKKFDGILLTGKWKSDGTCYISNLRLIFEEPDTEGYIGEIDLGNIALGGMVLGALGAAIAARNQNGERSIIGGITHLLWFEEISRIDTTGMELTATLQDQENQPERFLIRVKKIEEELTSEQQTKLKTLVETAREKAKLTKERESKTQEKLALLKELCTRKGFLNPEKKVEYDIIKKMDTGKTREEAIEELHEEVMSHA
jgi:hypothetical protein